MSVEQATIGETQDFIPQNNSSSDNNPFNIGKEPILFEEDTWIISQLRRMKEEKSHYSNKTCESNAHDILSPNTDSGHSNNESISSCNDYFAKDCTSPILNKSKVNLIVNYLPSTVTQDDMYLLFSKCGGIESCKLVYDKFTGDSLGYGFVKYTNEESASQAIAMFNGYKFLNKVMKVSYARPSSDAIKGANLYVSGLPKDIDEETIHSMFSQYGKIVTIRLLKYEETNENRGVAFIRYDRRCEAEEAVLKMDGFVYKGNSLTVKFANTPTNVAHEKLSNKIYNRATQMCIKQNVDSVISSLLSSTDRANNLNATRALTNYSKSRGGGINPHWMKANIHNPFLISLMGANTGAYSSSGWCLFVYNLHQDADENTLWPLFGPFGAVRSIRVIRDHSTNKCKGYAFVNMNNYEEALLAIQVLNGLCINNRMLQVSFKTTLPRRNKSDFYIIQQKNDKQNSMAQYTSIEHDIDIDNSIELKKDHEDSLEG